jgi:hypothetical protein
MTTRRNPLLARHGRAIQAMAREWRVASLRLPCGHAWGCWIAEGERYCLLSGEGWQKARCVAHAPEGPPEILEDRKIAPAVIEERNTAPDFSSVKHLAQAAETDWARKAANDVNED